MRDIDLIPRSYRETVQIRRLAAITGLALAALATASGIALAALQWQLHQEKQVVTALRVQAERVGALRKHTEETAAKKEKLAYTQAAIAALRGSADILQAAHAIDQALNTDIWLTSIRYVRNVQAVEPGKPGATPIAGEVVLQKSARQKQPGWRVWKQLEIGGAALSNASLSEFMRTFQAQPGIVEVRFLNSHVNADTSGDVVEFKAAAAVRIKDRSS